MRFSRLLAVFRVFSIGATLLFFMSCFLSCRDGIQVRIQGVSDKGRGEKEVLSGNLGMVDSFDHAIWPCGKPYFPGDLVLRCGNSLASRSVRFLDKDGCFSHIGILVCKEGEWLVVHAVPGEADPPGSPEYIKAEPIRDFLLPDKALVWGVYRYADSCVSEKASEVAWEQYRKKRVFDHSYDLADPDRMYCSELIIYSYLSQGVDFSLEGMDLSFMPGISAKVVFPSDIVRHEDVVPIYFSKRL